MCNIVISQRRDQNKKLLRDTCTANHMQGGQDGFSFKESSACKKRAHFQKLCETFLLYKT